MRTLDIEECAEFLKINKNTASDMASSGDLPGAKVGRAWVFLEDDLTDYLRNKVRQQQRDRQHRHGIDKSLMNAVASNDEDMLVAIATKVNSRRRPLPLLP